MVRRIDSVFSSNVTIGELSDTLDLVEDRVYEYLSTKSSAALEDYYRYEQDYRELLQELNNENVDSEIKMLEKNIRNMSETYLEKTGQTVQAKRGRNVERYKSYFEEETQLYAYINSYIYDLNNLQFRQNSASYQTLLASMGMLETFSVLVIVAVFALSLFLAMMTTRTMIRPLRLLSGAARRVAEGDFDVEMPERTTRDEIGIVTETFGQMLGSIRAYIQQVRESMEKGSPDEGAGAFHGGSPEGSPAKIPAGPDQSSFSVQLPERGSPAGHDGGRGADRDFHGADGGFLPLQC